MKICIFQPAVLLAVAVLLAPTLLAQKEAVVNTDKGFLKAGEPLTVHLTFDVAPSYTTYAVVLFEHKQQIDQFQITGNIEANQKTVDIKATVPIDAKGGEYVSTRGSLGPAPSHRYNANFTINAISVKVEAIPDDTVHPNSASATLSLTQQQFLRTERVTLQKVLDGLMSDLNKSAVETPTLNQKLIFTVTAADSTLLQTQKDYVSFIGKTLNPKPIFFEDFHRRYQALLVELRAPTNSIEAEKQSRPTLLQVQLVKRPPPVQREYPNYYGTYSSSAEAVISLIEENIEAYEIVESTQSDNFTIGLASIPAGATISYAHKGEPFSMYSSPTNVFKASFPLARWVFQFEKSGCKTATRVVNPFIERNPDLTVELSCSQR